MGSVVSYLEQAVPGAYVTSLMVGDNVVQDTENGFFLNINKQIDLVCQMVNNDEKLKSNLIDLFLYNYPFLKMATTLWASPRAVCSCEVWPRDVPPPGYTTWCP